MRKTIIAAVSVLALAGVTQASVLTFDRTPPFGSPGTLSQDYGDRITGASTPGTGGTYGYGLAGGATPNVLVSYLGSGSQTDLNTWETGYNDLVNVLEYEPDGDDNYRVTLSADAGTSVTLRSFDLGNYGGAITVPSLTVLNAAGAIVFQQTNVALSDSSVQSHLTFTPNVTSSQLTLIVSLTGLGGNSDNVGLDNIQFSQNVPEPTALLSLLLGGGLLRRRR